MDLLQFQDGLSVFCLGGLGSEAPEEPDSEPTAAALGDLNEVGLDDGLKYIDESCLDYRDDILKGILPPAVVGFEPTHQLRVVGEAELAWPESKVAIILQEEHRDGFENAGWKVFLPNQRDDILKELSLG